MASSVLGLKPGKHRTMSFAPNVRSDFRLVEVDEGVLKEIVASG